MTRIAISLEENHMRKDFKTWYSQSLIRENSRDHDMRLQLFERRGIRFTLGRCRGQVSTSEWTPNAL